MTWYGHLDNSSGAGFLASVVKWGYRALSGVEMAKRYSADTKVYRFAGLALVISPIQRATEAGVGIAVGIASSLLHHRLTVASDQWQCIHRVGQRKKEHELQAERPHHASGLLLSKALSSYGRNPAVASAEKK